MVAGKVKTTGEIYKHKMQVIEGIPQQEPSSLSPVEETESREDDLSTSAMPAMPPLDASLQPQQREGVEGQGEGEGEGKQGEGQGKGEGEGEQGEGQGEGEQGEGGGNEGESSGGGEREGERASEEEVGEAGGGEGTTEQ